MLPGVVGFACVIAFDVNLSGQLDNFCPLPFIHVLLAAYAFCILLSCFDTFYISQFVIVDNMLTFLWLSYLFSYMFCVLMSQFNNIVDIGALLTKYMPIFLLISLILFMN